MGRGFQRALVFLLYGICLVSPIKPQEKNAGGSTDSPYLIPQTVFVGDRARLVIPLGLTFTDAEPVIVSKPEELPSAKDLLIHRIELERRGGNARLLIDFTAFAPGSLALPPLKIPALESVSLDISIPIASILEGDSMVLSDPASPLTVPGTTILIYGAITFLFLVLLLGIGLKFWGREAFRNWGVRYRRRRLIRFMEKVLQGLRNDLSAEASEHKVLTCLSVEFRTFLSVFTGMPCHAMSAGEFINMPPLIIPEDEVKDSRNLESAYQRVLSGAFLCGIFRRCDTLRFSGTGIARRELFDIIDEIQKVIDTLNQIEKKRHPLWRAGASSPKIAGDAA
jgi:hypothetical protein